MANNKDQNEPLKVELDSNELDKISGGGQNDFPHDDPQPLSEDTKEKV